MIDSVIVLGGSGFLGRQIILSLKESGIPDIACADQVGVPLEGVKYIKTDILDLKSLQKTCAPFSYIINCTGQVTNPIDKCIELNSKGTSNIARICRKTGKRLLHLSSVAVYGSVDIAKENSPFMPEKAYSVSKACAEYIISDLVADNQAFILRLSNLYGSGQRKGIIRYLLDSYTTEKDMFFNNNGELARYYLHVEDCAEIIVKLIKARDAYGIYNVIGREKYSIKELVSLFEEVSGIKLRINYSSEAPFENAVKISDEKLDKTGLPEYKHSLREFIVRELK